MCWTEEFCAPLRDTRGNANDKRITYSECIWTHATTVNDFTGLWMLWTCAAVRVDTERGPMTQRTYTLWNEDQQCVRHSYSGLVLGTTYYLNLVNLTPSLPQPVKFLGRKMQGRACKQCIFRSYNIYFQCFVFRRKSFHVPVRKRRQKQLRLSNFALLLVALKWHHGGERVNVPAWISDR